MTSSLSDDSPHYVVTTRWAVEGILMVLVGFIGIIGRVGILCYTFFIRTKFIRTPTLKLLKKVRANLDFKCSLFLNLTYVLTENNQGVFDPFVL